MKISDIAFSLEHGALCSKTLLTVIYIILIYCILFFVITIITLILFLTKIINWNADLTIVFILGNGLFFAVSGLSLYILVKDKKLKSNVKIWMEDAIQPLIRKKATNGKLIFILQKRLN